MVKLKLLLKSIICSVLYHTGLLHLYMKWNFLKRGNYPAVIINYHRFVENFDNIIEVHPSATHSIEDFKKEIRFLSKYFDIRSLDDVVNDLKKGSEFRRPTIALTVDDGYKDNFDLMFPVLQERKVPATIFLSTAVIGTDQMNWYDRFASILMNTPSQELQMNGMMEGKLLKLESMNHKRIAYNRIVEYLKNIDIEKRNQCLVEIETQLGPPKINDPLMLNWDEVRTMSQSNISFGAHTHTHPILTKMPLENAKQDIARSKEIIEKELGGSTKHFAYPNGRKIDFNEELQEYCREIGFSSVSSFEYGHNQSTKDRWNLKRIGSESPVSLFAVNVVRAFIKGNE